MSDFQPNTTFYLLKGVKIDHSNNNHILFDNADLQYQYFYSKKAYEVAEGTYQRKTVGIINLPFLYDDIADCNYIMWQNANYSEKWYYAFILEIKYINPNVSQIVYSLDVIQTYMFDIEWATSQIDRDMIARKNANGFPVINREVEDLNYGTEYNTIYEQNIVQIPNVSFMVFACAPFNSEMKFPNVINNVPTNLCYFILPIVTATEGTVDNKAFYFNNTELTTAYHMMELFTYTSKLVNRLVSLKIYPFLPSNITYTVNGNKMYLSSDSFELFKYNQSDIQFTCMGAKSTAFQTSYLQTIESNKYAHAPIYNETKLMQFPYTYGLLTNKRGQDFIVKLEDIEDGGITLIRQGSISTSPKLGYLIGQYNIDYASPNIPSVDGVKYDQTQGIIEDIQNDLPIIDDYTASYLQSNANSINVANSNAKLIQQHAVAMATNTYNTQSQVLDNKKAQANANLATDITKASINAVTAAEQTAAQAGVSSKAMATGVGVGTFATESITALQTQYNTNESIRNSALIEANTLKNAKISANTDYQVAIASTNAKVQDASCVPATAKQLGGDYIFNILHGCDGIYFQIKTIKSYYANKLSDYFKRFGYKQNAMRLPALNTRQNWNYVKCTQSNIYGDIPQDDLLSIRDIFMCGTTLWHCDKIGDYSIDNDDISETTATITFEKDDGINQTIPASGTNAYTAGEEVNVFANPKLGYRVKGFWDYQLNYLIPLSEFKIKPYGTRKYKAISEKIEV